MRIRWDRHALLLATLTGLFGLRVAAQAVQFWMPQSWLPAFEEFQGSSLGYSTLLGAQLVILALMIRACFRVGIGASIPNRRLGRALKWVGALYMAGSMLRIVVGIAVPSAPAWFSTWIPAFFHLVLAGFLLTLADFHARRAVLHDPAPDI